MKTAPIIKSILNYKLAQWLDLSGTPTTITKDIIGKALYMVIEEKNQLVW